MYSILCVLQRVIVHLHAYMQDTLFEAAHITSSFKALAIVEVPDDEAALQRREEFLTELCSLTENALCALHPAQLVTLLWSCGRCLSLKCSRICPYFIYHLLGTAWLAHK